MTIEPNDFSDPTQDGIYACRQWYGWRILQWHQGEWWHPNLGGKWPASAPLDAWVGPLPVVSRNYQPIKAPETNEFEFDL